MLDKDSIKQQLAFELMSEQVAESHKMMDEVIGLLKEVSKTLKGNKQDSILLKINGLADEISARQQKLDITPVLKAIDAIKGQHEQILKAISEIEVKPEVNGGMSEELKKVLMESHALIKQLLEAQRKTEKKILRWEFTVNRNKWTDIAETITGHPIIKD